MTDDFHIPPSGGEECPRAFAIIATCVMVGGTIAAAIGGCMELYHTLKVREQRRINNELRKELGR